MTTDQFKPGDRVVYRSHPNARLEAGTVSSVNERIVFVVYDGEEQPKGTFPDDLEFEAE